MSGFGPVPGANGFGDRKDDESPWYKRWYVWVLPAAVIIGILVSQGVNY